MSIGYQGHLGIKQEAAYGEEAITPDVFAEIVRESLDMNNNLIRYEAVNGTRLIKRTLPGPVEAGGGITLALSPEGAAPWLLKGLFGSVASAQVAEGVYDHTFMPSNGAFLPSFTVQVDHKSGCQNWIGCTVQSASLSIAPDDLLDLTVELLAQRPKAVTAAAASYRDAVPWGAPCVNFNFNGVERLDFQNFNLTIGNNVTPVRTLNGKRWAGRHAPGILEVRGSVTFEFTSEDDRRRMWGGAAAETPQGTLAPGALVMAITHTDEIADGYYYTLTLNLPEIYYAAAPANIASAANAITQTVVFYASHNAASDKTIEAVLRNGKSGYPDPE